MPNFYEYNPEQAYLLPPSVRDVLGENHLCFFVHRAVEKLDLREFEAAYSEEGQRAYHPAMQLKVWIYAYALGMTSSRRLEERIKEDLAFRYLAGGAQPDYWALNDFRRRHGRAMNDVFTQVVELARSMGMGKLGHVAIDSTRIAANAAADSAETIEKLRAERAKIRKRIRRWQQQCNGEGPNEGAGTEMATEAVRKLEERLRQIPARIERLQKSGAKKLSRVDADSRFLRERRGFTLGYTATVAVSEDHLIVAQQVSQASTDNDLLIADGAARGTGMPRTAGGSERRQRIFLAAEFASDGGMPDRGLRAGHQSGTGAESRRKTEAARLRSGTPADAKKTALTRRTAKVPASKRNCRADLGSAEGAAGHAAVSHARTD